MGAPIGNQNAARGRKWAHAVERALAAYPDRAVSLEVNRGIDEAAFAFVSKLMAEKDLGFFRELGDRLDGKPAQAIVGDNEADPIQLVTRVELVAMDDSGTDSAT